MVFLLLSCSSVTADAQYDTVPPPQEVIDEPETESRIIVDEGTYVEEDDYVNFVNKTEYDGIRFGDRKVPGVNTKDLENDEEFWYANAEVKRQKGGVTYVPRRNGESVEPKEGKNDPPPPVKRRNNSGNNNRTIEEAPTYRPPAKKVSSEPWFQALMWIVIIGGFVGAVIWYLMGNGVGFFRKSPKKVEEGADAGDEEMPEDIFAIQYQKEIDKAAANGDYRLAIRLMYLRLLKNLTERNIIQYKQDKTNFDYLLQVQPTVYYDDFFKVTRHYEYSWYGKFPVSNEAYTIIKSSFDNFRK